MKSSKFGVKLGIFILTLFVALSSSVGVWAVPDFFGSVGVELTNNSFVSLSAYNYLNDTVTFSASAKGGKAPYSYRLYYTKADTLDTTTLYNYAMGGGNKTFRLPSTGTYNLVSCVRDSNGKEAQKKFTIKVSKMSATTIDRGTSESFKTKASRLDWYLILQQVRGTTYKVLAMNGYGDTQSANGVVGSSINSNGTYNINDNAFLSTSAVNISVTKKGTDTGSTGKLKVYALVWASPALKDRTMRYADGTPVYAYTISGGKFYNSLGQPLDNAMIYGSMRDRKFKDIGKDEFSYYEYTLNEQVNSNEFPSDYEVYIKKRADVKSDGTWDNPNESAAENWVLRGSAIGMSGTITSSGLLSYVSSNSSTVAKYLQDTPYITILNPFKDIGSYGSVYDIAIDYSFGGSMSLVRASHENILATRHWSVAVKKDNSNPTVVNGFANLSYVNADEIAVNTDAIVYIKCSGEAPYKYSVGVCDYSNISGSKVVDDSKVTWTSKDIKKDSINSFRVLDTVNVRMKEKGDFAIVVGVRDSSLSKYDYAIFKVSVKDASEIKNPVDAALNPDESSSDFFERSTYEYSLTYEQQKEIDDINNNREIQSELGLWSAIYVFAAFCGILLLVYSLLILVAFYIDVFNGFTDASLLQRLTFGKLYPVGSKSNLEYVENLQKDSSIKYATHVTIWLSLAMGVMASAVLLNFKSMILLFINIYQWVISLL